MCVISSQPLNAYFVLVACLEVLVYFAIELQLFPIIAAYHPLTTWIPIIVIFALTGIREAVEDYNRYLVDCVNVILALDYDLEGKLPPSKGAARWGACFHRFQGHSCG